MEQQTIIADHDREFNWHNYNKSQTKEKAIFVNILGDLCNQVLEPKHQKGRKPRPMKDIIFALVMKTYLNTSSRRVQSDLKLFAEAGFIDSEIPFNTLLGLCTISRSCLYQNTKDKYKKQNNGDD